MWLLSININVANYLRKMLFLIKIISPSRVLMNRCFSFSYYPKMEICTIEKNSGKNWIFFQHLLWIFNKILQNVRHIQIYIIYIILLLILIYQQFSLLKVAYFYPPIFYPPIPNNSTFLQIPISTIFFFLDIESRSRKSYKDFFLYYIKEITFF